MTKAINWELQSPTAPSRQETLLYFLLEMYMAPNDRQVEKSSWVIYPRAMVIYPGINEISCQTSHLGDFNNVHTMKEDYWLYNHCYSTLGWIKGMYKILIPFLWCSKVNNYWESLKPMLFGINFHPSKWKNNSFQERGIVNTTEEVKKTIW